MLKFYYLSNNGDVVDFHGDHVFSDEHWLRSYEWDIDTSNGGYTSIRRPEASKDLDVWFFSPSERETSRIRNAVYEIFDSDVLLGEPGRLYVGEYYLECFITGIGDPQANMTKSKIHSVLRIKAADSSWKRSVLLQFLPYEQEVDIEGLDYPYDYPYDYAGARSGARTLSNPFSFPTKFEMKIYGGTGVAPAIEINGVRYGVNTPLLDGENLIIDGHTGRKSVTKVNQDFSEENWFGKRLKETSIFTPIPGGVSDMTWDGSYGFDLTLFDERSEPPFDVSEPVVEIPDGALTDVDGVYILTSAGEYIVGA